MGRKPKYENPEEVITSFFAAVSESFNHPSSPAEAGRDGHKKQEILADEFQISRIKVRKILITTGDFSYPATTAIQELTKTGLSMDAVCQKLGISLSTANSLLPYSKGVYGLDVSAAADRTAIYRSRVSAVQDLRESLSSDTVEEQRLALWKAICLFSDYPFQTSGRGSRPGIKFKYTVSGPGSAGGRHYDGQEVDGFGNEMWISTSTSSVPKKKSISRSTVDLALKRVIEAGGQIAGPKALNVPGAHSYLYPIFVRFGLITVQASTEE